MRGWRTDFTRHSVPLVEIQHTFVPKDGIRPIYEPRFEKARDADGWMVELEPVVVVVIKGDARAYPEKILAFHEIVNDVVGGQPIAVTW